MCPLPHEDVATGRRVPLGHPGHLVDSDDGGGKGQDELQRELETCEAEAEG